MKGIRRKFTLNSMGNDYYITRQLYISLTCNWFTLSFSKGVLDWLRILILHSARAFPYIFSLSEGQLWCILPIRFGSFLVRFTLFLRTLPCYYRRWNSSGYTCKDNFLNTVLTRYNFSKYIMSKVGWFCKRTEGCKNSHWHACTQIHELTGTHAAENYAYLSPPYWRNTRLYCGRNTENNLCGSRRRHA